MLSGYFMCNVFIIIMDYWWFSNFVSSVYLYNRCKNNRLFHSYLKYFYLFVLSKTTIALCASNQQKASLEVLTMWRTQGIFSRRTSKRSKVALTESSIGISLCLASNNTPSSPPSGPVFFNTWRNMLWWITCRYWKWFFFVYIGH